MNGARVDALLDEITPLIKERELPDRHAAAREVWHSAYAERVRAFVEWCARGRQLTSSGHLRPGDVHDAVRAVELSTASSRTATEHRELLDRLWWGAASSGQLRREGERVRGAPRRPRTAADRLQIAFESLLGLMDRLELRDAYGIEVTVRALILSCARVRGRVQWTELDDERPTGARQAMGELEDTGLVLLDDDGVSLTGAGDYFVVWWLTERSERGGPSRR